jgi:hypothetical protein
MNKSICSLARLPVLEERRRMKSVDRLYRVFRVNRRSSLIGAEIANFRICSRSSQPGLGS